MKIHVNHKNMYCQYCGNELPYGATFCPGCGRRAESNTSYNSGSSYTSSAPAYDRTPKEPPTAIPFVLGLLLGVIGVIIAVLVYNGNDGPYTKNPTIHALVWSIIGMVIWIPIMYIPFFLFF